MCLECDTVWVAAQGIHNGKGQNFEDFMSQRGQVVDWLAITEIRQVTNTT